MDNIKSISRFVASFGVMLIAISMILQGTDMLSVQSIQNIKLDDLTASSSAAVKNNLLDNINFFNNNKANGTMRVEVYNGMTLDEVANQINKSLK